MRAMEPYSPANFTAMIISDTGQCTKLILDHGIGKLEAIALCESHYEQEYITLSSQ